MENKTTREKIIDASIPLFAQYGYKGTTTKMIANAAGVNELTIFRCFGTKEGILSDLFDQKISYLDGAAFSFKGHIRYELYQDLTEVAMQYQDILTQNIHLVMFVFSGMGQNEKYAERFLKLPSMLKNLLVDYFDEMQRLGRMIPCISEEAAAAFISLNLGYVILKYKYPDIVSNLPDGGEIEAVRHFARGYMP